MNRYWKKKLWNEYGIKVKRIRIAYNPFNFWGVIPDKMYILYYYNGYGFKQLETLRIFTSVNEILNYLDEQKRLLEESRNNGKSK